MPSTTLTIDQIEISPWNVRTYRPDAEDTGALELSILAEGLLNPIVVHPMRGRKGKWGAIAGGRRTRAIRKLVERGALPKDWAVKVDVREDASEGELVVISTAENLIRKDLREHELFAAIARAKAKGIAPEQIAEQLGQDLALVRKWARMGELAKPVFDAFVAGEIGADVAKAFAATADVALQAEVFARLKAEDRLFGNLVLAALRFGDREEARLLTFVGEAVYRAAGGSYELNLFADLEVDRGRVTDPALLRRLADEKLASVRDQVRVTCGDRDLRFIADQPRDQWGGVDHQLAVTPRRAASGSLTLPDPAIVAHLAIDAGGEPVVTYWWESRKAKFGTEKGKTDKPNVGPVPAAPIGNAIADDARIHARVQADAAIKEEAGLSQDTIQVFRSLRKNVLRALLIDDARAGGDVATDYLVWAQLRMLGGGLDRRNNASEIGMCRIAEPMFGLGNTLDKIQAALTEQPAAKVIAQALFELTSQTFFTDPDLDAAFLDYRCSADSWKRLAAAVVAGLALERSLNAPGYDRTPHDTIAVETQPRDVDLDEAVRRHWLPTEQLLGQLPKSAQLAIAAEFVDDRTLAAWGKAKVGELTHLLVRALTGASPSVPEDRRDAAARWVHPLLRFDPSGPDSEEDEGVNDALELQEAAE